MTAAEAFQDISAMAPLPQLPAAQTYLHPGQLFFTVEPTLVTTILGPCVSVCLFDRDSGAAGVNHYLMPMKIGTDSPRFADVANDMLLENFRKAKIPFAALQAKVFGGAAMRSVKSDLADRNIKAAFDFLKRHGIRLVASDVGGDRGRRLLFCTSDGRAWVKLL